MAAVKCEARPTYNDASWSFTNLSVFWEEDAWLMFTNVLFKAELGKTKRRCFSLPGPNFTYGQSSFLKEGGVAEAIGHWQTVEAKARERKLESNFVALNREAVKSGLVTAAEHQAFRNTHKIWRPINEGRLKPRSQRLPQDMTYGICTRPSTPIYDLIEQKYQRLWLEQQLQATEALRIMSKEKIQQRQVQDTKTTLLRRYQPPADPAPLWKLARFEKILLNPSRHKNQEAEEDDETPHLSPQRTPPIKSKLFVFNGPFTLTSGRSFRQHELSGSRGNPPLIMPIASN